MESSIQDLTSTAKKLSVSIPPETFQAKFQQELNSYSKQVRIKGFRPGKAPVDMVKRLYGEEVKSKITQDLISSTLRDAAKKHAISIVGTPKLTLDEHGPEKGLKYSADVSIYPTPEVSGFDSFAIEVPSRAVTEKEIEDVIAYIRKNRAELTEISDRTALAEGDVAEVEIAIFDQGAEAGRAEPFSFCLGEGTLPAVVETALAGIKIGETRDAVMERAADKEGNPSVPLVYRTTLKALKSRKLPELNDEFAKLADPSVDSVAALTAKIKTELEAERGEQKVADQNAAIIEKLLAVNNFDVPQELVDEEIIGLLERRGMIEPGKYDPSTFPMEIVRKEMNDGALSRVRAAIIVDRIAEKAEVKLEKEDIEKAVADAAKTYRMSPQEVSKILLGKERATGFLVETLRNKVLATLRTRATVTEKAPEATEGEASEGKAPKKKKK
jgi:trigger factor